MTHLTSRQTDIPRQDPLAVMTLRELRAELDRLTTALGPEQPGTQPDLPDDDWEDTIKSIIDYLPSVRPDTDTLSECLHASTFPQDRLALAWRVAQVKRALDDVPNNYGKDYDPTATVLLPASYARRFELLIGKGALPLVWVRALDVCQF
ncbi:MAG: hypothetical protein RPU60_09660 [Candidatus Sedimenticola sp. (ex Thyasira tokunagai)]